MKTESIHNFMWRWVVILVVVALPAISPVPAAAQSVGDYFQISYDPVTFSKTEIQGSEAFYATLRGSAVCTNDLPVTVSEARVVSRVVAIHGQTSARQELNSSYTVLIKPFPSKKGQSYQINQQLPLQFPATSQSGNYTVTGELIKAEVKVGFLTQDVTGYLPQSQSMGSVKYVAPGAQLPTISFSPSSISFAAFEGSPSPPGQTLTISNSGGQTLNWSVAGDATWLTLNPTSGSSTGNQTNVTVSVNISGKSAGSYNATITISASGATNSPKTIPVSLTISPPVPPALAFSPSSFSFVNILGGPTPSGQTLTIWNSGGQTINWLVTGDAGWLSLSPTSGTSTGNKDAVSVSVNISEMGVSSQNAVITISAAEAANSPMTIPVTLTIKPPPPPTISFTPSSISFTAYQGSPNPPNQTLTIWNSGGKTVNWSLAEHASWLSLNPTSGTSTGNKDDVIVSINISGMTPGSYDADITIGDSRAANSPQTVPVTLTINPPSPPTISFSPPRLNFVATLGGSNPSKQTLTIWNSAGETLNWSAAEDATWLSLSPTSGSSIGDRDAVSVSVNISGMSDGSYNTDIIISASGATNNPKTVPVTLTLNPPSPPTENPPSLSVAAIDIIPNLGMLGLRISAEARLTIVDSQGKKASGVLVLGHWSGSIADGALGKTDSQGMVIFSSKALWRTAQKVFTFTVDDITKSGWTYDPTANVKTTDSLKLNPHKIFGILFRSRANSQGKSNKSSEG